MTISFGSTLDAPWRGAASIYRMYHTCDAASNQTPRLSTENRRKRPRSTIEDQGCRQGDHFGVDEVLMLPQTRDQAKGACNWRGGQCWKSHTPWAVGWLKCKTMLPWFCKPSKSVRLCAPFRSRGLTCPAPPQSDPANYSSRPAAVADGPNQSRRPAVVKNEPNTGFP